MAWREQEQPRTAGGGAAGREHPRWHGQAGRGPTLQPETGRGNTAVALVRLKRWQVDPCVQQSGLTGSEVSAVVRDALLCLWAEKDLSPSPDHPSRLSPNPHLLLGSELAQQAKEQQSPAEQGDTGRTNALCPQI